MLTGYGMLTGYAHSALSHDPLIKLRQTNRWKEGPRGGIPINILGFAEFQSQSIVSLLRFIRF